MNIFFFFHISRLPFTTAICSGIVSFILFTLTKALHLRSNSTIFAWPKIEFTYECLRNKMGITYSEKRYVKIRFDAKLHELNANGEILMDFVVRNMHHSSFALNPCSILSKRIFT